ncbi:MAG: hypothetical protein AB8B73_03930 [Ekhidna sp.]
MMSLKNILTIAKFESKVLWRNWFFRIFAIAGLFFITIFNIAAFSALSDGRQSMIGSTWGMPYATMVLSSIAQAAAVIFLATGVILKNKKIDTNEVFYARPISNLDYVLGRAFAIFKLFFLLNVVVLIPIFIVNITNPLVTFNPLAFIAYPLLTSIPTIVFVTGVSFLLVTLIKNQPISIVLLLGLSGVELIYFHARFYNIFDYMAFRLNLLASDIIGFSNLETILMHRGAYFIAGIAFLFAASFFLDRLPNTRSFKPLAAVCTLIIGGISAFLFVSLWNKQSGIEIDRQAMIEVNNEWSVKANADVISNHIQISHLGDELAATATLSIKNNTNQNLSELFYTLNPSLEVSKVLVNQEEAMFERDLQILSIASNLGSGQSAEIVISYRGDIDERIAHLEVDQKRYEEIHEYFIYSIEKRYAFLSPEYVLLTKDVLWYPDTQIGYSNASPVKQRSNFIDFKLDVIVENGLTPVAQGEMEKVDESTFSFSPEYALPQLSLAIGNYVKKSIVVDSIDYAIYHYPKNDYFLPYFDQLEDTLSYLITDLANSYEHDLKLNYPFNRLQLVETPTQFRAYDKIYEGNQAYIQPEMILLPEKGGSIRDFDFKRQFRNMDRQAREENKVMQDKEKQASVFNTAIKKVLTKQIPDDWFWEGRETDVAEYSMFPNLYTYSSGVVSQDWILLNKGIADYLNTKAPARNDYSRSANGISFAEECNQLMQDNSLIDLLIKDEEFVKIQKSVSLKNQYLFAYLGQLIGEEAFKTFLVNWINNNSHAVSTYQQFKGEINKQFQLDIDPIIKEVYYDNEQPSFLISNAEEYEILDGDRKRFQIIFNAKNLGPKDGVISINFEAEGENDNFNFFNQQNGDELSDENGYVSLIKNGQTKQFGFILNEQPGSYAINTLVSKNIPSIVTIFPGRVELKEKATAFEGERVIEEVNKETQYQVIVDNEDEGFSTFSPIEDTYLKTYLDKRNPSDQKYFGVWNRPYSKWLATTGSSFHGEYIRSAHFTRSGKGEKTSEWKPDLKEAGFYDIYSYMIGKNQSQYDGNRNDGKTFTYQYIIHHGDGEDEVNFNVTNAENGWNYLGSYYFDEEGGSIVLTDKCELRSVYADAIKWVKQ